MKSSPDKRLPQIPKDFEEVMTENHFAKIHAAFSKYAQAGSFTVSKKGLKLVFDEIGLGIPSCLNKLKNEDYFDFKRFSNIYISFFISEESLFSKLKKLVSTTSTHAVALAKTECKRQSLLLSFEASKKYLPTSIRTEGIEICGKLKTKSGSEEHLFYGLGKTLWEAKTNCALWILLNICHGSILWLFGYKKKAVQNEIAITKTKGPLKPLTSSWRKWFLAHLLSGQNENILISHLLHYRLAIHEETPLLVYLHLNYHYRSLNSIVETTHEILQFAEENLRLGISYSFVIQFLTHKGVDFSKHIGILDRIKSIVVKMTKQSSYIPYSLLSCVFFAHKSATERFLASGENPNKHMYINKRKETAASISIKQGHTDIFCLLLKYGADINLKDDYGKTLLHHVVLAEKLSKVKKKQFLELLLTSGCLYSAADNYKNLALHYAVEAGDEELVRILFYYHSILINRLFTDQNLIVEESKKQITFKEQFQKCWITVSHKYVKPGKKKKLSLVHFFEVYNWLRKTLNGKYIKPVYEVEINNQSNQTNNFGQDYSALEQLFVYDCNKIIIDIPAMKEDCFMTLISPISVNDISVAKARRPHSMEDGIKIMKQIMIASYMNCQNRLLKTPLHILLDKTLQQFIWRYSEATIILKAIGEIFLKYPCHLYLKNINGISIESMIMSLIQNIYEMNMNPEPSLFQKEEYNRISEKLEQARIHRLRDEKLCLQGCSTWCNQKTLLAHERYECEFRFHDCKHKCGLKLSSNGWRIFEKIHTNQCSKRLVLCKRNCSSYVPISDMNQHILEECKMRPISPIHCPQNCGEKFTGIVRDVDEINSLVEKHVLEVCPFRVIECSWPNCNQTVIVTELDQHKKFHMDNIGVHVFVFPGAQHF